MNLVLKRRYAKKTCVCGKLTFVKDDKTLFSCFTCEEDEEGVQRDKDLRIPAGIYDIELYPSAKFGECILLSNEIVPKDRGILIHIGNTAKNTQGCILLGESLGDDGVINSKIAFNRFMTFVKTLDLKNTKLKIVNELA
ncbi:DUF5675 family protein [Campylobacter sp. CCS1377]|uniref:DUF5675 family protein n=1 Tax=Campylobacter sp. CCS1377 TaxID=3158229 RepID=A0AAU7E6I1_9BACT